MTKEEFEFFLSPNGGRTQYVEEWVRYFKKECKERLGHKPSYEELKLLYNKKFGSGYKPSAEELKTLYNENLGDGQHTMNEHDLNTKSINKSFNNPYNFSKKHIMEKRIDRIIKKTECLYSVLTRQEKETNNLKGLISNLKSYRDNFGDIIEREYFFTLYEPERPSFGLEGCKKLPFRICDNICNTQTDYSERSNSFHVISIPLVDFTEHIFDKMRTTGAHFIALPSMCKDNSIADAIFDIQSYPVEDNALLVAELYRVGFNTKNSKVRFISDFD